MAFPWADFRNNTFGGLFLIKIFFNVFSQKRGCKIYHGESAGSGQFWKLHCLLDHKRPWQYIDSHVRFSLLPKTDNNAMNNSSEQCHGSQQFLFWKAPPTEGRCLLWTRSLLPSWPSARPGTCCSSSSWLEAISHFTTVLFNSCASISLFTFAWMKIHQIAPSMGGLSPVRAMKARLNGRS